MELLKIMNRHLKNITVKYGKFFDSVALFLIAFFYTLAWNWSSTGPVYLSDTVAYLVNAAILAGHNVDAMGSWHAGYSILLAPLFLMDDPFWIWKGVQIVNAALVALAVYLSSALLDQLQPDLDRLRRGVCLVVIILYPTFSAIAGWAFASSILSVNVLFICLYLVKNESWSTRQAILLGLLAGFTYWIHPTGIVIIFVALVALFFRMAAIRLIPGLAYLLTCFVMGWVYKNGIHEALYRIVTPDGFSRYEHYQSLNFSQLLTREKFFRFFALSVGHLSYQLVSTLGLVWVGVWHGLRITRHWFRDVGNAANQKNKAITAAVFAIFLIAGVISIGAMMFALTGATLERSEYWIYGRYTDAVLHPLLLFGLLFFVSSDKKIKFNFGIWATAILILVVMGVYLHQVVDIKLPHNYETTLAFWPQFMLAEKDFSNWMLLGTGGIVLMSLIVRLQKWALVTGLLIVFVINAYISGLHNIDRRKKLEISHSRPSAVVDVIRSSWPRGTSVGFAHPLPSGLSLMQSERYRMYAFYFFNYGYRRHTLESWKADGSGPLLTFDPLPILNDPELKIILVEESTGLFLVSRKHESIITDSALPSQLGQVVLASTLSAKALVAGCFSRDALKLSSFSKVGVLDCNVLKTDGRAGFLFHGPYRRIDPGNYEVIVDLDVRRSDDAVFDVVSGKGTKFHARIPVTASISGPNKAEISFSLSESVHDLEVRLHVGRTDQISIVGYKIQLASGPIE